LNLGSWHCSGRKHYH